MGLPAYSSHESGFYYLKSRYYDPAICRFINADGLASTGQGFLGANMFAYCGNDPVNRLDSTGQDWWHWGVAALAVTALVVASIVTCGGAAAAAMAASAIVTGTCSAVSTTAAVITGAAVGSSIALVTTAIIASEDSNSLEEFADYGEAALINTTAGGFIGGAVGHYNATNLCFVAGTLVQTKDGTKPIEEIVVGDKVWAWDEETGEVALKPVLETYINETEELIHVYVNGEEIVSTPGHPFYSPVKGWTDAVNLRAGDILVLVNGEYVVVEKVQHELLEAPINVYNFNVDGFHTYFVSSDGILVHNTCRGNATKNNYRIRAKEYYNTDAFGQEAHHVFPQKFESQFSEAGINIHDPRNIAFLDKAVHQSGSYAYNKAWQAFFADNPGASYMSIIIAGQFIMEMFS